MTPDSPRPGTDSTADPDATMRTALAAMDPAGEDSPDRTASVVEQAWVRVESAISGSDATFEPLDPSAQDAGPSPSAGLAPSSAPRRRWWELATAACLGAALVGGSVVAAQNFTSGGSDSGVVASDSGVVASDSGAVAGAPGDATTSSTEPYAGGAISGSGGANAMSADSSSTTANIARSASATVATEDLRAARDSYVATVTGLGGRVTSETTTTGGGGPVQPMPADAAIYPPVTASAGIFLDLEVPAAQYDQAVAAIAPLGEVVELTQSSYDTGSSIAEGDARITALQESLARLKALLSQATSVSEVIELENAITSRQSELDALTAQQRYLTDQVEKSRISLQLLTPQDAQDLQGTDTWWSTLTAGLTEAWMWLGRALAWTSPLWIAGLLWWAWRRRTNRRSAGQ